MMSRREPIDQVLLMTAELVGRTGTSSVDVARVHGALQLRDSRRWPADRREEIKDLMVEPFERGDLRLPPTGPLRGDNQVLDVDVLGLTPQGRQRVALLMLPCWRRAWRWPGRPVTAAVWTIVVLVIAGVIVAAVVRWLGLP